MAITAIIDTCATILDHVAIGNSVAVCADAVVKKAKNLTISSLI